MEYLVGVEADAYQAELLGAEYAYGSYYDVLPLAYGSKGRIRAVSSTYNRFPITDERTPQRILVAVNSEPKDEWGVTSLERVSRECRKVSSFISSEDRRIFILRCPGEFARNNS